MVILDIQLPDMNGLEVFRRLREIQPDLRVIILSAHAEQEYVLEALRLGACDYLAKPIHEEELALAVRRALETFTLGSDWHRLRERLRSLAGTLDGLWHDADRARPPRGRGAARRRRCSRPRRRPCCSSTSRAASCAWPGPTAARSASTR